MKSYKKALTIAAREAYNSEVIETGMVEHIIGNGKDYATALEWIEERISYWLEQAEMI